MKNTQEAPKRSLLTGVANLSLKRTGGISLYFLVITLLGYVFYAQMRDLGYNWQWERMLRHFPRFDEGAFLWGELAFGLKQTIFIVALSYALALALGVGIALLRLSGLVMGTALTVLLRETVRNIPFLVLLYLSYYVVGPVLGVSRVNAAIFSLVLFHSVLIAEIIRAGIEATPKGQWEAARSIGLRETQTYWHIIFPQATRFTLPSLMSELVHMIKSSAILSVIAVTELTTVARNLVSDTYMSFEVWFTVALIYFILTTLISIGVSRIEKRLSSAKSDMR